MGFHSFRIVRKADCYGDLVKLLIFSSFFYIVWAEWLPILLSRYLVLMLILRERERLYTGVTNLIGQRKRKELISYIRESGSRCLLIQVMDETILLVIDICCRRMSYEEGCTINDSFSLGSSNIIYIVA